MVCALEIICDWIWIVDNDCILLDDPVSNGEFTLTAIGAIDEALVRVDKEEGGKGHKGDAICRGAASSREPSMLSFSFKGDEE